MSAQSGSQQSVPPRSMLWGVAEDGACLRVLLAGLGASDVRPYWPPRGLEMCDDEPARAVLLELAVDARIDGALAQFESDAGLFAAEHLDQLVAVHAAVIRVGDRTLLLPGPSMAGKSTLCAAAIAAGHAVLSDEYALVDQDSGLVVGWPRPLRLRTASGWERRSVVEAHDPVAIDLVASIAYAASTEQVPDALDVHDQTPGEVTMALLANTVCAQVRPQSALSAALAIARGAHGVAGVRGEAPSAMAALVSLLQAPGPRADRG